ncbi:SDR family oxidoreductase [Geodermatophilus obscurus]|uniref:NmrA family protein n=1 Tax=Geodermatophilus obscurus (strain ATCC 25078 / DSM 43160 / JCM 3152 / CCUG 61914 / KCC A-0152 / KCTC 9177 / NBRC 13315 / NRRL B-3577 / G-20) TaxID=526225 RepID=D2SDP8_GEOOG|nr:NAD(P)H-binding protein [Geodermatophilus obscurus]ADB74501.1 NmrA family protein [Geodermatophilus obscurus DSM 43160]
MSEIVLCGATGDLGGRIAVRLAERRIPFRALVRPHSDTAVLRASGAELSVGDLTDPPGPERALAGARTVVTTANALGRSMAGARDVSIERVDRDGNAALVRAAEAAGVERFVFVSGQGMTAAMVDLVPFFAAKRATERLLQASSMRSVIVRPAAFQEAWLGPESGIRPEKRLAVIYGRGRTPLPYVAEDDVAEACIRLATMDDPPGELDLGGPEALTRHEVVDALEHALGVPMRRIVVPRRALAFGARALRRRRPELASILGIALSMDVGEEVGAEGLRTLGIEPRPASAHIAARARAVART